MNHTTRDTIPGTIERVLLADAFVKHDTPDPEYRMLAPTAHRTTDLSEVEIVTSMIADRPDMHAPVLDLDVVHVR